MAADPIQTLYDTQANQAALYSAIWTQYGQPLEGVQAVDVVSTPFYTPKYTALAAGIAQVLALQSTWLIGESQAIGNLVCYSGLTNDRRVGLDNQNALMRIDAITFAYRTEDARLMMVNGRRLNARFRFLQHARGLSSDASTLAKNAADAYAAIEDSRAKADASGAYFATRIVDATDSSGNSVWSDVAKKLST